MSLTRFIQLSIALIVVGVGVQAISQQTAKPPKSGPPKATPADIAKLVEAGKVDRPSTDADESAAERALDKPLDLKFKAMPLNDAAEAIAAKTGINVVLDQKALADSGIKPETPVNLDAAQPLSLRAALGLILGPHDLNFIIDADNVLLLTTNAAAKEHVVCKVYDAHDLAATTADPSGNEPDFDALVSLLTATIDPASWTSAGGTGSIQPLGGQLVVVQSREVHEQIADLFRALREVRAEPQAFIDDDGRLKPRAGSAEAKIAAALAAVQDFDYRAAPLKDVVADLRKRGIPADVDEKSLADAGLTPEPTVTFKLKQASLATALRLMLHDQDLNYTIDHELLHIVSDDSSKQALRTAVYPVADLIGDTADKSADDIDTAYGDLITVITATVVPASWTDSGGTGSLSPLPMVKVLVCSQSREGHEQVAEFLAKVRAGRRPTGSATHAKPADPNGLVTRLYRLSPDHADAAGDYAEVIRHLVEPKSWTGSDVYLGKVPGAVVARCPPATHLKIRGLLNDLEALPRPGLAPFKPGGGQSGGLGRGGFGGGFGGSGGGAF